MKKRLILIFAISIIALISLVNANENSICLSTANCGTQCHDDHKSCPETCNGLFNWVAGLCHCDPNGFYCKVDSCGAQCNSASPIPSQSCGNCSLGAQTQTCNTANCYWSDWSACTGEGVCAAGTIGYQDCNSGCGTQSRTCTSSCAWPGSYGTCSLKSGNQCFPGDTQSSGCQTCSSCMWSNVLNGNTCTVGGLGGGCYSGACDAQKPTVSVSGTPLNWINSSASASVSCSDASGCNTASYKLKVYSSNPGSCSQTYTGYGTSPQIISDYSWICGAAKDNAGNLQFSGPAEFKIDKEKPLIGTGHAPLSSLTNKQIMIAAAAGDDKINGGYQTGSGMKNLSIYLDANQQPQKTCTEVTYCNPPINPITGLFLAPVRAEDIIVIEPELDTSFECIFCSANVTYSTPGTHSYYSIAYDNAGNMNKSEIKQFSVTCSLTTYYYYDADGDTYGNATNSIALCSDDIPPAKYVLDNTDCNDNSYFVNPEAVEICNGIDDNCNNETDEELKCGEIIRACADIGGIEYDDTNFTCSTEPVYAGMSDPSNTHLKCCTGALNSNSAEFDVYWSRQNSGYYKLTEAAEGEYLYCVAKGTASSALIPVQFNITKPSKKEFSNPNPKMNSTTIALWKVTADEIGIYKCNGTSLNEGKSIIASIKVSESGTNANALPFFGIMQFIAALIAAMVYCRVKTWSLK